MKTLEEIKAESYGVVLTTVDFITLAKSGALIPHDGDGCFHDGEKESNISVWSVKKITFEFLKKYPYVVWYNK